MLTACVTTHPSQNLTVRMSPAQASELQQGEHYFDTGFYKHAMETLLPLACDGIPDAQYAVGYMYYYGYGVSQDTEVGKFWIARSANKGYEPAKIALNQITSGNPVKTRSYKTQF